MNATTMTGNVTQAYVPQAAANAFSVTTTKTAKKVSNVKIDTVF